MTNTAFNRSVLGFEAARLLEALLEHVGDAGRAQVSTAALLKASGLTQGALVRARTELTQHGLLRTEPGFSDSGLRGANIYTLDLRSLGTAGSSEPSCDESGQNRTGEPQADLSPATTSLPAGSTAQNDRKKSLFSRLFRRDRAS